MLSPVHGSLRRVQAEFPLIQVVQATIAATGAPEVWVTHGEEDALVH
jgi:hypothetical protein